MTGTDLQCTRCDWTAKHGKGDAESEANALAVHEAWCGEVETIALHLRLGFRPPMWATRHQIEAAEERLRDVEEDAEWVQSSLSTHDGGACP